MSLLSAAAVSFRPVAAFARRAARRTFLRTLHATWPGTLARGVAVVLSRGMHAQEGKELLHASDDAIPDALPRLDRRIIKESRSDDFESCRPKHRFQLGHRRHPE